LESWSEKPSQAESLSFCSRIITIITAIMITATGIHMMERITPGMLILIPTATTTRIITNPAPASLYASFWRSASAAASCPARRRWWFC
jgi:hypothetical protein